MNYKDKLIKQFADATCQDIAEKTVLYLQSLQGSGIYYEDVELLNKWDEFCAQAQYIESVDWDFYVLAAKESINAQVEMLPIHVNQAIWLQTNEGFNWTLDNENEDLDFYCGDDITNYIYQNYLITLACKRDFTDN